MNAEDTLLETHRPASISVNEKAGQSGRESLPTRDKMHTNAWRTLANFCCKSGDLPTYAQKLSMYAGLKIC